RKGSPFSKHGSRPRSREAAISAGSTRSRRRRRMLDHNQSLREADPEVAQLVDEELRRQRGGNEVIDRVEQLAIDRGKRLFGADHVNVQPHSGAQANFAAFMAVLPPGALL